MPTRRPYGTWLLLIGAVPALAAAQERTEQQLLELILRESPRVAAIQADVDVVRREQAARVVFPNPNVSYTREGAGVTEFLQGEQLLPIFGSRGALARAGTAAIEAAEAERDAKLWILRNEARRAIARLAAAQERGAEAKNAFAAVERLVGILRTREQEGEGSRFDRVRAEQELAEARQLVLTTLIAVAAAREGLETLLPPGVNVTSVAAARIATDLPGVDVLWQRAARARAELRALERAAQRFTFEAESVRRQQRPTPSVVAGLKRAETVARGETGGTFGISVNLPLFNTGSREAERWVAERQRIELERAVREAQIRGEVARAAEVLELHQRALGYPVSDPASTDQLVEMADTAYREGEAGILELLDAYRTAARTRAAAMELRLSTMLAQIALERAVGESLWP